MAEQEYLRLDGVTMKPGVRVFCTDRDHGNWDYEGTIVSAAKGAPVKAGTAAFGEVGLTGRLRPATQSERRLEECEKLGLRAVVAPTGTQARGKIRILEAATLGKAARAGIDAERTEGP